MCVPTKTYSSDYNSTPNYMRIPPPRTGFKPWLTVKKSIINSILSPTLTNLLYWAYWAHFHFLLGLSCNLWPYINFYKKLTVYLWEKLASIHFMSLMATHALIYTIPLSLLFKKKKKTIDKYGLVWYMCLNNSFYFFENTCGWKIVYKYV